MDNALLSTDPIVTAAAALAAERALRRLCADPVVRDAMLVHCPGALARVHSISAEASGRELFSGAVLDDLRDCIAVIERVVASGTKVGYETYDAWDERGETTVLHCVEKLTPGASVASRVQVRLERLEELVAHALDLIRARSLVLGARPAEAFTPVRCGAAGSSDDLTLSRYQADAE
jgi:hypothetical protein